MAAAAAPPRPRHSPPGSGVRRALRPKARLASTGRATTATLRSRAKASPFCRAVKDFFDGARVGLLTSSIISNGYASEAAASYQLVGEYPGSREAPRRSSIRLPSQPKRLAREGVRAKGARPLKARQSPG